ncbi:MAG TPA: PEP-CTERM sorting domain-containing protein, partial [Opitutales bacterium]|nr:PEP-CTERM sorting domain-containing protein [Opitutales bacterium]
TISVVNFNNNDLSPSIFLTGVEVEAMAFSTVPEPSAAPAVMGLAALAAGYWRSKRKTPWATASSRRI